uniref:C2H2-type domain-containing protein n=1 Tax=Tetranychus urticae TaxID=32264 RepID=T1KTB8_TETUR
MKVKLYLDHLNPAFYRKMREAIVTGSPDFLFLVKNGYKKMFHVDLLTLLSTVIHNHIRSCRADGFKGDSMMLPSLGSTEIDCLHELIYKDVCEVDQSMVDVVVKDLTELGFSVSDGPMNNQVPSNIQNTTQNNTQNNTQSNNNSNVQNNVQDQVQIDVKENQEERNDQNDLHNGVQSDGHNDTQSDRHSDVQTDAHNEVQNTTFNDSNDHRMDVLNESQNEVNNNVQSDNLDTPVSTGKKPRGCKVKYPLSPAQEELVKFYRLIEESLPNPKPYFVGKDVRCFHCNQLYPKVRLWKEHIMNDHYHRAQTCENCGESFTYTFYLPQAYMYS